MTDTLKNKMENTELIIGSDSFVALVTEQWRPRDGQDGRTRLLPWSGIFISEQDSTLMAYKQIIVLVIITVTTMLIINTFIALTT